VNIHPNRIEVLSFPGLLPPGDNKMLKKERIVSREYRNRRIGDFLKELQLTEGRATGFPRFMTLCEKTVPLNPYLKPMMNAPISWQFCRFIRTLQSFREKTVPSLKQIKPQKLFMNLGHGCPKSVPS